MRTVLLSTLVAAGCVVGPTARADVVTVVTTGLVESNVIQGNMVGVQPGTPVVMSFTVDSTNFVNSPTYPTRGYPINLSSFAMTVDGRPVPIVNPQPNGQAAYFVMRNNDPAVDGFFVSSSVDIPLPIAVNIVGLTPVHELDFLLTSNPGTNYFPSLDILSALGTYDTSNLSVYNWTIGRFGNPGAFYTYQSVRLTTTPVPEPGSLVLAGAGCLGLAAWARRRYGRHQRTSAGQPSDFLKN